jgi:hypothetical protein
MHQRTKPTKMNKLFIFAAALLLTAGAFAQSSWRMGITAGSFGNRPQFNGGMTNASALFTPNPYHTGDLGVVFRKTINSHLSFQTGLNFSSLGFEYAMARDYNLTHPFEHYMVNKVRLGLATIPATLIWNFNPNCKNVRWFVGGGLSLVTHGNNDQSKNVNANPDDQQALGLNAGDYINQTVSSSSFTVLNGHVMGGLEKLFKKGGMLSLALQLNRGFTPVAYSNVTYSVNGTVYNHSFKNYNNFAGLTLTYYFKNFKGKMKPAAQAAVPVPAK